MKLAIMQPYFFPYIGYFNLIKEVDEFIIYDDVNFIKGGWINRNKIVERDHVAYLNIPMIGASSNKKINQILLGNNVESCLNKIRNSYSKAPYFNSVYPFVENLIRFETISLSHHLFNSIKELSNYFELNTNFKLSSQIIKDNNLKGQEKVLSICKSRKATHYVNSEGGMTLYSKETFKNYGIDLKFLISNEIMYNQFGNKFFPNLSILDVMMFNDFIEIKKYINNYSLI